MPPGVEKTNGIIPDAVKYDKMHPFEFPRQKSLVLPEIKNPFSHRLHFNWYDYAKIALMTITIFPIRCLAIVIILLLAWPLACLGMAGRKEEEKNEPISGWRSRVRIIVELLWRSMFFAGGFHWIRVIGERASAMKAPIIAIAPHSSFMDGMVPSGCMLWSAVVAKAEAANVPIFGKLIKYTQPVFVRREDANSRTNTIKEIKERAQSGGKWPQIVIFPEGTCTNRSALITFKPGAFYPGVPVQPVCIRYPNRFDTVTWTWDGPGALLVFWLTLCQFHNYMEVEFLPVYNPSDEEIADPKLYAHNVRALMAENLGVPATDHTYDDCRLMMYAAKRNMPMTSGLVEFQKLSRKLGINFDNMKELLDKFSSITDEKGHITLEVFANHLGLPVNDTVKEVFDMYDRDGSGTIDFREYVIGLSLISMPANTDETLQLAFRLFDVHGDGYITLPELTSILHHSFNMEDIEILKLFNEVDANKDEKITYDEFKAYAVKKPEYARLFTTYRELRARADESLDIPDNGNGGLKMRKMKKMNANANCNIMAPGITKTD
ncbi:lysophosphatidylcholine acyltransferase 2-like isoform X2 [Lineus longissimus]|uniref:lysophosphatidylcholine acyltransferase 2-like isoform X2 n=1 Tax=Lineus longissimus TaxID=88925 RepID=UPI00315C4C56